MGHKASKAKKTPEATTASTPAASVPAVSAAPAVEPASHADPPTKPPEPSAVDQASGAGAASSAPELQKELTAEEKKAARKSQRQAAEAQKEKEKQEKKRKEKEEKAMKEAEKRMTATAKRKSIKSKDELREESHAKVADVVAFLNDVEKTKKEDDAIAMLDDLIEEDKLKKQASGEHVASTEAPAAPVAPVPPADDGPRDLVSMLEKLQKLIEDPQMLQRLEELLGQKLTSDGDATKLKSFSNAEMEQIERVLAQDTQWAQRRREERELEMKALTERVNLADKRKSYVAVTKEEEKKAPSTPADTGVAVGSVKRRSQQLNVSVVQSAMKKQAQESPAPKAEEPKTETPVLRSAMKKSDSPASNRKRGVTIQVTEEEEKKHTMSGKKLVVEGKKLNIAEPKKDDEDINTEAKTPPTTTPVKSLEPEPEKKKPAARVVVYDEDDSSSSIDEDALTKKEAENKAKLAAYRAELEERKRKNAAELRRKAMEMLEDKSS